MRTRVPATSSVLSLAPRRGSAMVVTVLFSGASPSKPQPAEARALPVLRQAGSIARQHVDFEVDALARPQRTERGHLQGMRNDEDGEIAPFHYIHRERDAIQRNGAFRRDEPRERS